MISLSIGPVRRWRRLTGLFAVLLVLAGIIPAYAASLGVVNGSFGTLPSCSLDSWTISGSGYTVTQEDSLYETRSCVAKISVTTGLDDASVGDKNVFAGRSATILSPQYKYATLEQRFLVTIDDPRSPWLTFYIEPKSNSSGTAYMAQMISLYNSAGQLIYGKGRNTEDESEGYRFYKFSYDLSAYAGQYVTLRVTSQLDPAMLGSPTAVSLKIDFDCPFTNTGFCGDGNPGNQPPGAW